MMTHLTAEFGLEVAFGTLGVTLASRQLPAGRTTHTLIPSRATARITAQVTFHATATIAVVAVRHNTKREKETFCRLIAPKLRHHQRQLLPLSAVNEFLMKSAHIINIMEQQLNVYLHPKQLTSSDVA